MRALELHASDRMYVPTCTKYVAAVVAMCEYSPYDTRAVQKRSVDIRRAVAKGMGYGEAGGRVVMKHRRVSAGLTSTEAFEQEESMRVIRRCKAEGLGSRDNSVGGYGVMSNIWMMLARSLGVPMIMDAVVFVCWARRCRIARSCNNE